MEAIQDHPQLQAARVLFVASLFAAAIPMLFFLYVIWKWDLYDRKPIWLMGGAFLWGALGAVLLAIVGDAYSHRIGDPIRNMERAATKGDVPGRQGVMAPDDEPKIEQKRTENREVNQSFSI